MRELSLVLPETLLLTLICVTLLVDVFSRPGNRAPTFWLAVLSPLVVAAAVVFQFPEAPLSVFSGTVVIDPMGSVLKLFAMIYVVFACFYARDYLVRIGAERGEYYVLTMSAALGIMVMAGAGSLLTVYLGLELMSLSLYAMVAMLGREEGPEHDDTAAEAAMKYFVLGAMASGLLLYGMSMLYGIGGSLELGALAGSIGALGEASILVSFALVFVIVGIAFKLGVVPFHMWVPDIYQGASTPATLFIASAPKIGAFAMAMRLLADGLPAQQADWQSMLAILALLSMAVGNIIAIAQSNLKRMLAYSTIAHMGFLLLGMLSVQASGYAASMFYVLVYALTTLGAFALIILISGTTEERDGIDDFAGLARINPWFGFVLLILMFSLAGVPPFAGFWAKWFVIKEALAGGYTWLAIAAVVFSVIGAFYYLRMVKIAYFDAPAEGVAVQADADMKLVLSVNGLVVLALGIAPGALMAICVTVTALYR